MKKAIFLAVLLLSLSSLASAQSLTAFFDKYADDERFNYSKVGKEMQTLSLEITPATKTLAENFEKEILEVLKKENFEQTVASRSKGESSYIYSRPKGKQTETVIINKDKKEINLLWTTGKEKKAMNDMENLQGLNITIPDLPDLPNMDNLAKLNDLKLPSTEKLQRLYPSTEKTDSLFSK
jgi:hypothetical protein